MRQLFQKMISLLGNKKNVVLCSILASAGSAPRGTGARMAVFSDGSSMGTIGGGAIELQTIQLAKDAFQTGTSMVKIFTLTPNHLEEIGMICGGKVTVYIQYFSHSHETDSAWLKDVYRMLTSDEGGHIIYSVQDGIVEESSIYIAKKGLLYSKKLELSQIQNYLKSTPVTVQGDSVLYVEPIYKSRRVWLFGGGHIGRALVPILHSIDFSVTVYDNRKEFAVKKQFPLADQVLFGDYKHLDKRVQIGRMDYVAIMTSGHQGDYELLEQVLDTPAAYIGCIGSKLKMAKTTERLLGAGHTLKNISRIHSPIGLDLHGETPAEIAISIAAEMIRHRADQPF